MTDLCESKTGVSSCESVVGEPNFLEDIVLFGLEGGDLVGKAQGTYLARVVMLELGDEAPVVETFRLLKEDGECLGVSGEEAKEPGGKGVQHGLPMVGGGGI